jgi:uncharacterized protein (TIGR00266 family)
MLFAFRPLPALPYVGHNRHALRFGQNQPAHNTPDTLETGGQTPEGIHYQVLAGETPALAFDLEPGKPGIQAEPGAFLSMDADDVHMDTRLAMAAPNAQAGRGWANTLWQGAKRVLAGENLFVTHFTAPQRPGQVMLAAPYPGTIVPVHLCETGPLVAQRGAFLAATPDVKLEATLTKRPAAGLVGGEGFVMQRLSGKGLAFLHAGGRLIARDLQPGQTLKIDTGCLVAMSQDMDYDIRWVGGLRNVFGGEGLFLTQLRGPGRVYLQTMPFSKLTRQVVGTGVQRSGVLGNVANLTGAAGGSLLADIFTAD